MTSIRQLAKLAGVSTATVVRALHDSPYVRPETRQRILELASLYSYHPRPSRPEEGKTGLIGCLVPSVSSPVFGRALKGVLAAAYTESFHVVTLETHNNVIHSCKALDALVEQRVEGIIIASGHRDIIPQEYLFNLWSHGIHIVAMDNQPFETKIDTVESDYGQLAEISVQYLHSLGHRTVAYVGPVDHEFGARTDRVEAFRAAMRKYRLPTNCFIDTKTFTSTGKGVAAHLLKLPHPPTAVITWMDTWAAQLIKELQQQNVPVPREMSVIGCANYMVCDLLTPELTTIEQSPEVIGEKAVQLLCTRIAAEEAPAMYTKEQVYIPVKLIARHSCARPPMR